MEYAASDYAGSRHNQRARAQPARRGADGRRPAGAGGANPGTPVAMAPTPCGPLCRGIRGRHTAHEVVRFLRDDPGFESARAKYRQQLSIAEWIAEPQRMRPVRAAEDWQLPAISSVGELAEWLSIDADELEWFAELKGLGNKLGNLKLQHYRYDILAKRSGGVRLIEKPKSRLKGLQGRILRGILEAVPVHPAAHGFVKGRSIVTFAAPHADRPLVLRLDLRDFFPAFPGARIQSLFRTLGYPERVADRLGGICTNAVAREVWKVRPVEIAAAQWNEARSLYTRPHLPQGAPTSPVISNLTAYRLDCRLSGLAKSAGAIYTRYADDRRFPAVTISRASPTAFRRTPRRSHWRKDSASTTTRRASCDGARGSSWRELWSTKRSMCGAAIWNCWKRF